MCSFRLTILDANREQKCYQRTSSRGVTKVGSGTLPEDIVGIQYLKQKTIGDVARHAMQLRWMHQRIPRQPDYHQVCMEWYDFRLIKTVITALLSAFHNVSIKIYGASWLPTSRLETNEKYTGKKKKRGRTHAWARSRTKRCIRSECACT